MQDKQHIMNTAISLFKDKGYDHVTVSEICKEAGIAYSTFFYQFKTKSNVLWEYCTSLIFSSNSAYLALTEDSPLDKLMCLYRDFARIHEDLGAPLLLQFLILRIQNPENWLQFQTSTNQFADMHCALIEAARRRGEIRNASDAMTLTTTCGNLATAALADWAANPNRKDLESYFLQQVEILFDVAPEKRRYSFAEK